jgi:hypothetical protein
MSILHTKKIFLLFISFLISIPLSHGQSTIVPAGLGEMRATQLARETSIFSGELLQTGGQNPTVKIVWGDEDRGAAVSALSSWDNMVIISTNQAVGSFSTTITIPNQEKIYYFRSVAENAGGTVVSRSLGVLNPSAPVGISDLQGRWSFDDDNFSVVASPSEFSGMQLWLDASGLSSAESTWTDKSGSGNSASKTGAAVVVENDQNGLSVMNYTGNGQYHDFTAITDIRTVFWVVSQDTSVNGSGYRFLLCGASVSHFHNNANGKFWGSSAENNIKSGYTRMNGSVLSGDTNYPNNLSIISLRTVGNVSADRFGQDRGFAGRQWVGKLGELIIYNSALSDYEMAKVESYLSNKWAISIATDAKRYNQAAKDSSANEYHGILRKTFSPTTLPTLKLWLDATDSASITQSSNAVSQWNDKSGNNYHATATSGQEPTTGTSTINGNNALTLGSGKKISSTSPANANWQDLYLVAKWNGGANFNSYDGLFTGTANVNGDIGIVGHQGTANLYSTNWFDNIYLNGATSSTNGVLGTMSSNFILSVSANSAVSVNGFLIGLDRTNGGRYWNGVIGEVIAFESKLSDSNRHKVEGYLAHKWGLTNSLANTHPGKTAYPLAEGSPSFITDSPFGDGKSIDLANGHVEISTGGNEDRFDGNASFSVSAWVKGWPEKPFLPIISKGGEVPSPTTVPSMKLWLDAQDLSTMDQGTSAGAIGTPTGGSNIKYWADKSGNGHHATSSGSPKYNLNTINSSFPSVNTDVGDFTIANSQSAFEAWDSMTVIFIFEWLDTSSWEYFLQKGNGFVIQKMNTGANQGTGFRYGSGWGDRLNGGSKTDARSSRGSKILSFTYTGSAGSIKAHANGTQAASTTSAPSSLVAASSNSVTFGKDQRYGELFIFRNALSDSERQTVESYLALKWGMTSTLPSSHKFNLQGGWSVGRDEKTDTLSTNFYGIGAKEKATHSTALSTDNQWHHIVSTYDGGTRKIYLDGTEVSSTSASGSVASTTSTLLLGATDLNATAGSISASRHSGIKLDEVRFYSNGLTSSQVSALYNFGKGDIGNIGEFATLPSKISGTKGTALSATISAAFSNAYYEAVNLTPGLSINSATGEISGTPSVGGVGSITVIARNSAGKRAVTTIPYDSNPSGPALSFPTLSPSTDHAVVIGEITHSGGEENTVDLIWGTNATRVGTQFSDLGVLNSSTTYRYQNYLPSGSDLLLWLDADDNTTITHSSNAVSQWNDKSGNGNHATQSTASRQPTYNSSGTNGKSVIDFDGTSDFLTPLVLA